MIIRRQKENCSFGDLAAGEIFSSEGNLFMVTDLAYEMLEEDIEQQVNAVCLSNGSFEGFALDQPVEKVNGFFQVQ